MIKGTPGLYLECEWCNVKKKRMRRAPKWTLKRKMCVDQSKEHQASSSHVDSTFDGNNATPNMKKELLSCIPEGEYILNNQKNTRLRLFVWNQQPVVKQLVNLVGAFLPRKELQTTNTNMRGTNREWA